MEHHVQRGISNSGVLNTIAVKNLTIKLLHAEKTQLEETVMEIKGTNCDIFAPLNKANERRIFLISERACY
jgi:hypothetical protein